MNKTTFVIAEVQEGAEQVAEATRAHWAAFIKHHDETAQATVFTDPSPEQIEQAKQASVRNCGGWLANELRNWACRGGRPDESFDAAQPVWAFRSPGQALYDEPTGQLVHEYVKRYFSEFSRVLHEHKQQENHWTALTDKDWSYGSGLFMAYTVQHQNMLRIQDVWVLRYVQDGETYVGGFFTEQDKRRFRYSSKRLGAYLTSLGWDDEKVRAYVEQEKISRASSAFTIYPNDVTWGDVYMTGPESCMSRGIDSYESSRFNVHPADAYASAYRGSGDNGLALFVVYDVDGKPSGRGIVSTETNQCVRWYGDYQAERALVNAGIKINSGALVGSWLALIGDDDAFVHPYVDGGYYYGEISTGEGRVYLSDDISDGYDLEDTYGTTCLGPTVYCAYSEGRVPESRATYYPYQDVWISDDVADELVTCYITDEPIAGDSDEVMLEDGAWVTICYSAYHNLFYCDREVLGWRGTFNKEGERIIVRC